ncbi:MAG TPA: hypothetical protein VGP25_12995 [Gemmatimonadaceae bacterium]|jgi:hypothetical protein|nr:hypothetical protein [Gemmatimonadaceae bacterium]
MAESHEARLDAARARYDSGEPTGAERITPNERAPVAQWVGMFLAPAAFAAHLEIAYNVIPWACVRGGDLWMHIIDVAAVLLALVGTIVAWRVWQRTGRDAPGESGGSLPRTSLLGVCGLGLSAMITLVLFGQWIAAFYISTCQ